MNTVQLTSYIKVVETGSFSKASEELYVSVSSVMKLVTALESYVGAKLLSRSPEGITLTPAGESMISYAKRLIALKDESLAKVREIAGGVKHTIKIGTSSLRPCNCLMEILNSMEEAMISFNIEIVPFSDDSASVDKMFASVGKDIDCFVGPCSIKKWDTLFNSLVLRETPCCLAVSYKNPISKKRILRWSDLSGKTVMLVKRGEAKVIDEIRDRIINEHPKVTVVDRPDRYDMSTFDKCDEEGMLLHTLEIWSDVHPKVATVAMEWEYRMPYGIIYSKEPSDAVKDFISAVSKNR